MDKEIKQKWVEALRSGKYKQGEGALKRGNKYCCLGVLCSITSSKNWRDHESLPSHLEEKFGLYSTTVKYRGESTFLEVLNDGDFTTPSLTFPEIADIIEAQL
jgi:hypothetical protein